METYMEFKTRQREEMNGLPIAFAFSNKQFADGMAKLGLSEKDTDKVVSIPGGGFMVKTDSHKLVDMILRHDKEWEEAVAADTTGTGFIFQAFNYELANHEYCVTGDPTDTLRSLGLSMDEIINNPVMDKAFKDAVSRQWGNN